MGLYTFCEDFPRGLYCLSTLNLGPVESTLVQEAVESSRLSILDFAERVAGFFLLVITVPVTAVSALALSALSGRSPLVAHLRVGKDDKPFWMLKLRTMWEDRSLTVAARKTLRPSRDRKGAVVNPVPQLLRRRHPIHLPCQYGFNPHVRLLEGAIIAALVRYAHDSSETPPCLSNN